MTYPVGPPPDGAYVVGDPMGQGMTEAQVMAAVTGGTKTSFGNAQNTLKARFDEIDAVIGSVQDSQLSLGGRLDLLEGVQGYCSMFLGKNWRVGGNRRITLPFETQLGPNKGAYPLSGKGIQLGTKGLWRVDAHLSYVAPPTWFVFANTVIVQTWIKVFPLSTGMEGASYTERCYNAVIGSAGPESVNFSHTFVVPTDNAYGVVIQVSQPSTDLFNVQGGTVLSGLSVNKWDSGVSNAVVADTVPDGGSLT